MKKSRNRKMSKADRNWIIYEIKENTSRTNESIGKEFGVSEARVRAIYKKCCEILGKNTETI